MRGCQFRKHFSESNFAERRAKFDAVFKKCSSPYLRLGFLKNHQQAHIFSLYFSVFTVSRIVSLIMGSRIWHFLQSAQALLSKAVDPCGLFTCAHIAVQRVCRTFKKLSSFDDDPILSCGSIVSNFLRSAKSKTKRVFCQLLGSIPICRWFRFCIVSTFTNRFLVWVEGYWAMDINLIIWE